MFDKRECKGVPQGLKWKVNDNVIICENLYFKIYRKEITTICIEDNIRRIAKKNKCNMLEASEILKKELKEQERGNATRSNGTANSGRIL